MDIACYDVNDLNSIRIHRELIPICDESLLTYEFLHDNLKQVIQDLKLPDLPEEVVHELLMTLYLLSFKSDVASKIVLTLQKQDLDVYKELESILQKNAKFIALIFSTLANLTGEMYVKDIEENNKFFRQFLFKFLESYEMINDKNLSTTIEMVDKFTGFLYVNQRLYDVELDEKSARMLIKLNNFIESIMPNFKRQYKKFQIIRMNLLSVLFNYLNANQLYPEYIADYVIVLIDMIKKIVKGSTGNSVLSDDTIFYAFYHIKETKTFIYCLDVLERLRLVVNTIKINDFKQILFHENVLPEVIKVIGSGNNAEVNECAKLLLELVKNESIKAFLVANKQKLNRDNCSSQYLKTLLSQL